MPQRPRTHQLEDISIHHFKGLLPPEWVCRQKGSDYGVDLEVEVFDRDGASTGLTFIVQVKATDDASRERITNIKVDRLQYLARHDVPSMVVRYCHPTKAVHFAWVTNLLSQVTEHNAKSVTIHFATSDAWTDSSYSTLQRTLVTYRRLKIPLPSTPIGLTLNNEGFDSEQRYALNSAISELRNESGIFTKDHDPATCLPVAIVFDNGAPVVSVDVLFSVRVQPQDFTLASTKSAVLYALAIISGRFGFQTQCIEMCRMINHSGLLTNSRLMVSQIAIYSIESPEVSSELVAKNCLHELCDEHHFSIFWRCSRVFLARQGSGKLLNASCSTPLMRTVNHPMKSKQPCITTLQTSR